MEKPIDSQSEFQPASGKKSASFEIEPIFPVRSERPAHYLCYYYYYKTGHFSFPKLLFQVGFVVLDAAFSVMIAKTRLSAHSTPSHPIPFRRNAVFYMSQ